MTHPDHRSHADASEGHASMARSHYLRLLVMAVLSFTYMYGLMYAMVDSRADVLANLNQAYMAALMTSPMIALELLLMRMMYRNVRWNAVILAASAVIGIACFAFIRRQTGIRDEQFLRSMIPHHGAAILMCEKAPIQDQAIQRLCRQIIASQSSEIEQMKGLLRR